MLWISIHRLFVNQGVHYFSLEPYLFFIGLVNDRCGAIDGSLLNTMRTAHTPHFEYQNFITFSITHSQVKQIRNIIECEAISRISCLNINTEYKSQFIFIFNSMRAGLVRLQQYAFTSNSIWATAELHKPEYGRHQSVTLIPGIGIGPEITNSVIEVFRAGNIPVDFDIIKDFTFEDLKQRDALHKNKCILLGVMVPEKGVKAKYNDNHKFYKHLDLFANINLCFSHPSITTKHNNVDIAVIRENTEGQFTGIEHQVYPGVMESLKVTTKANSLRLIQYAFEFAHFSGRKKVSVIHKANIMKLVDGLFLEQARLVAKNYPFIKYEQMIVDNCSMQLVKNPSQFDVMVAPNLYGSIISHICAGITGGVGMTPGACIGNNYALFSQGMPHSGMNIAGKNIANPTSILLSSVMMLRYLGMPMFANKVSKAVAKTLQAGKVKTADIGGSNTTTDFTKEIITNLN